MKNLILIMCVVLMTGAVASKAESIVFTESGEILEGEVWDMVDIFGDDTIVDMSGGSVDYISTFDSSTLNMIGGRAEMGAFDTSTINIFSGNLSGAVAWDNAEVNLFDCDYSLDLSVGGSGIANMTGGTVEYLSAGGSGIINLFAGLVTDSLNAWDSAAVNVYGYDLSKTITGGVYGYGQMSGFWLDDTAFTIDFSTAETYSHINLVPEPGTLILMGLGMMIMKRRCGVVAKKCGRSNVMRSRKRFLCVLLCLSIFFGSAGTSQAKSVYAIIKHQDSTIAAYDIQGSEIEYQTDTQLHFGSGAPY